MFDSIELIFYQQIYLNLKKFKKLKKSAKPVNGATLLSTAVELSNALFHFREHFSSIHQLSRSDVESRCPAFEIVGDVANAFKHGNLSSATPHGAPHVQSASDVTELDVIVGFLDEVGPYWHSEKCISINSRTGNGLLLDDLLVDVFNFWRKALVETGKHKFPLAKRFAPVGNKHIPRSRARLGGAVVVQGLPFQSRAQIKIFDPESSQAVPFPSARNLADFCEAYAEIRVRFLDDEGNPIILTTYEPPSEAALNTFLDRIREGGDMQVFRDSLAEYEIDLDGLLRDRFGTSMNGRKAAFDVQRMVRLTVPSGSVSVIRRPGRSAPR